MPPILAIGSKLTIYPNESRACGLRSRFASELFFSCCCLVATSDLAVKIKGRGASLTGSLACPRFSNGMDHSPASFRHPSTVSWYDHALTRLCLLAGRVRQVNHEYERDGKGPQTPLSVGCRHRAARVFDLDFPPSQKVRLRFGHPPLGTSRVKGEGGRPFSVKRSRVTSRVTGVKVMSLNFRTWTVSTLGSRTSMIFPFDVSFFGTATALHILSPAVLSLHLCRHLSRCRDHGYVSNQCL